MELDKSLFFKIKDMNCEFRTLHDSDVSKEYVNDLKQQTQYITNIPKNISISSQKIYIKDLAKWISKKTRATILYSNEKTDSFTLNNNKLLNKLKMDKKLLNLKKNIIRII